ncbi:MAG: nucleotidyltransferase domain-containing protein [Candidatus Micrarchaeota archaeon]
MRRTSRLDIGRSKEIRDEVKSFARKLARAFRVKNIYMFGSFARGDYSEASDIDLLIIGDFPGNIMDRYASVRGLTKLPIEPFCYTQDEVEEMKKDKNPLLMNALRGERIYP